MIFTIYYYSFKNKHQHIKNKFLDKFIQEVILFIIFFLILNSEYKSQSLFRKISIGIRGFDESLAVDYLGNVYMRIH